MKPHVDCLHDVVFFIASPGTWRIASYINCNTTDTYIDKDTYCMATCCSLASLPAQPGLTAASQTHITQAERAAVQWTQNRARAQRSFFPFPFRNAAKIVNGNGVL